MNDEELLRYSRQIMLPEVDVAGQEKLLSANVLLVGAGGLGCPAAMSLVAAGVGHITIADNDLVELSNLQRQIGHTTASIGRTKVDSLAETLAALNPASKVKTLSVRLKGDELESEVQRADIVVDCTDNLSTRLEINKACKKYQKPLVSGAAIRMEAQLSVYDFRDPKSSCYQCLYGENNEALLSCSENGVLGPLVSIIGSMQALEAIKLICSIGEPLSGRLLVMDATIMQWRELKLEKNPNCDLCAGV